MALREHADGGQNGGEAMAPRVRKSAVEIEEFERVVV